MCFVRPNAQANQATAADRQARAGENVPRTATPGLAALPLGLASNEGLGGDANA
jgi:hypothetical protein